MSSRGEGTQREEEEVCQAKVNNAFDLGPLVHKVAANCADSGKMFRSL